MDWSTVPDNSFDDAFRRLYEDDHRMNAHFPEAGEISIGGATICPVHGPEMVLLIEDTANEGRQAVLKFTAAEATAVIEGNPVARDHLAMVLRADWN
jgi:hypothetical protein